MPELPEVETIRRDLLLALRNKKVVSVDVFHAAPIKDGEKKFKAALHNKIIKNIERVGKLLMFELSDGNFLLIHLKMTGQLIYKKHKQILAGGHSFSTFDAGKLPDKYTWVRFGLQDGAAVYFNDMRKFGYLKIATPEQKAKIVSAYGIEPLAPQFTFERFNDLLEKRNAPIKSVLLNQALIAGIGNIYADESCFAAGIFPGLKACKMSLSEKKRLFAAIKTILKKAIKYKGTTFKNYLGAHGRKGNFSDFLRVYQKDGTICVRCRQGEIQSIKIAGRSSRYCPVCQKMLH